MFSINLKTSAALATAGPKAGGFGIDGAGHFDFAAETVTVDTTAPSLAITSAADVASQSSIPLRTAARMPLTLMVETVSEDTARDPIHLTNDPLAVPAVPPLVSGR